MKVKEIYTRYQSKKLKIEHVCEVGVFSPEKSNILDFIIKDRIRSTLVEPDPKGIAAIKSYFADYDNVKLYPYAIYDYNGVLQLAQRGESTFATDLPSSPALVNENYEIREEDTFKVECRKFDEMDDGTIDLLSVDTEGCEWYILKNMKSRPKIISLETHGKSYINPYIKKISEWIERNEYDLWFMDKTDSVYYKKGAFTISLPEKIQLAFMKLRVVTRRWRKNLTKSLRSKS